MKINLMRKLACLWLVVQTVMLYEVSAGVASFGDKSRILQVEEVRLENFLNYYINLERTYAGCGGTGSITQINRGFSRVTQYSVFATFGGSESVYRVDITDNSNLYTNQQFFDSRGNPVLIQSYAGIIVESFFQVDQRLKVGPCQLQIGSQTFQEQTVTTIKKQRGNQFYSTTLYPNLVGKTTREFQKFYTGAKVNPENFTPVEEINSYLKTTKADPSIPQNYDLRTELPTYRGLNPDNQLSCGSCFAFAASKVLSFRLFKKFGINTVLSQRQIGNCYTTNLCNGGDPAGATSNFMSTTAYSVVPDWCEPYLPNYQTPIAGDQSVRCAPLCTNSLKFKVTNVISGFAVANNATTIATRIENIQKEILANGPVGMYIAAAGTLSQYKSGVIVGPLPAQSYDHVVTLMGWGTFVNPSNNATIDYWLAQNSWGPDWGEKGYFRIQRGINLLETEQYGVFFPLPTYTSPCPTTQCMNGGELKPDCTCFCNNPKYTGNLCQTCSIACGSGSTGLNSATCTCNCGLGYYGEDCKSLFIAASFSYSGTSWPQYKQINATGTKIYAGDVLLVDDSALSSPSTSAGQWTPCTAPSNGAVIQCVSSNNMFYIAVPRKGSQKVWIKRYLGNNEFGVAKGYSLDPTFTSNIFVVS